MLLGALSLKETGCFVMLSDLGGLLSSSDNTIDHPSTLFEPFWLVDYLYDLIPKQKSIKAFLRIFN